MGRRASSPGWTDETRTPPAGESACAAHRLALGGICRGSLQLSAKSRGLLWLIQSAILSREVFSRGTNETGRGAALLDQDFITGQGLGFRVSVSILAEQRSAQLNMHDAEVYVVAGQRFLVASDHVAKELLRARIVLLVHIDAR